MWIAIGFGLFILAALLLIVVALHENLEETASAIVLLGFLSFVGTIFFSALNDWKIPTKESFIESAMFGLLLAFGMAVIGLLALIISAPIRMISRAIANRTCATCAKYHDRLHQLSQPACPECLDFHAQAHQSDEDLEFEEDPV